MFVPNHCPKCGNAYGWHRRISLSGLGRRALQTVVGVLSPPFLSLMTRPAFPEEVTFHCSLCGYTGTYSNHAETLNRRRHR